MNETEQLLNSLRDIQEPLAPQGVSALLIVANVLLLLLILAALLFRRQRRREGWRREALSSIASARKLEPQAGLLSLAKLLRQIMHYRHGHSNMLDGQEWLMHLDRGFNTQWFSREAGRIFGDALYSEQNTDTINLDALCNSLSALVKSLPATQAVQDAEKC